MNTTADKALTIAAQSRFPISYDGDALMYYGVLCGLLIMAAVLAEQFIHIAKQLWCDRKKDYNSVFTMRVTFLLVCFTALIRVIPEVVYRIAWNEVTQNTLQMILTFKESLNILAVGTAITWVLIHRYFEPLWTLRLNAPMSQVWGGNKKFLKNASVMAILCALLAGAITFFKAFG